jgi:hypothetical protein
MGNDMLRRFPADVTVAATEVGYIGAVAPQVRLIDLSGLNDPEIARRGVQARELLARRPDLIWMPNSDYTYERSSIFSQAELLEKYTVYDGALSYGIAIRKDSPYRAVIEREWENLWADLYPGYEMSDYIVQSVSWSRAVRTFPRQQTTTLAPSQRRY